MFKKYASVIFCSFLILCFVPAFANAQFNRGNDRVCVYRDNNFNGREQCYYPGDDISNLRGFQVSSIRVDGRARVIVYENPNFHGNTAEFNNDIRDLAQVPMQGSRRGWNDRVGSLRVVSDNGRFGNERDRRSGGYGYPSYPNTYPNTYPNNYPSQQGIQQGVCVYDKANFEGRSQCWSSSMDLPDLGQAGWSDKIQSIRVFGGAHVTAFRDIHFQGERVTIDGDIANLSQLGMRSAGNWNRQISSLQIEGGRGYGRGNRRNGRY